MKNNLQAVNTHENNLQIIQTNITLLWTIGNRIFFYKLTVKTAVAEEDQA